MKKETQQSVYQLGDGSRLCADHLRQNLPDMPEPETGWTVGTCTACESEALDNRLDLWLSELRAEISDNEIVAGLDNGELSRPQWVAVKMHEDHVDLIDTETTDCFQLGFTSVWGDDTDSGPSV